MRKLVLRNFQSPGDIVMLTAAVRDLHISYPDRFLTDVRTSCPALWEHNPRLVPLNEDDPDVEVLDCHYPLIHRSNEAPYHFLHGFIHYLNDRLGLGIEPSAFKGDIHISDNEKEWFSQVEELHGASTPFRQLVRLMYHAQGVVTPVSLPMHLAAAVEVKPGMPKNRPCVVIAGGREPPHWTAYPHHQFIHTVGALCCCDNGGCWKSRTVPLGDGDYKDGPDELCVDVVGDLPRCMDMITAEEVIRRIEWYFEGGAIEYLPPGAAED